MKKWKILKVIACRERHLREIPEYVFSSGPDIESADFSVNYIVNVPNDILLLNLKILKLNNNELTSEGIESKYLV